MKPVDAERYQKRKGPTAEEIDFAGPTIEPQGHGGGPPVPEVARPGGQPKGRTTDPSDARPEEPMSDRPSGRGLERPTDRPTERTEGAAKKANVYPIEVPQRRIKARWSFDIFEDQKQALDWLQIAIQDLGGDRPNLGKMVQEALDAYIRKRAEELPNVWLIHRPNGRSDDRPGEEDLPYG